jgi:hypothetical protein
MTARAVGRAILGLSIVLAACRSSRAQEAKPSQPARSEPGKENGGKETPDKAVGRLIEGLRQHPVERSAAEGLGRIYALDVETGRATLVADESVRGRTACGSPTWSHDGRQILFDAFPRGQTRLAHLKLIELAASGPAVTDLDAGNCPAFSPDDSTIVTLTGADGNADTLALIDVSEPLKATVKEVFWKKKEPDIEVIDPVYSTSRHECVYIGVTQEGMALYSVRHGKLDPPKRLKPDAYDALIWDLAFSPDGRYVLFGSTRPDRRRR